MLPKNSFYSQRPKTDNLTSKVPKGRPHFTKHRSNFKPQYSEFSHTISDTTISSKRSLEHLTDTSQQSVTVWIRNMKHSLKHFSWSEEIEAKVLLTIIGIDILPPGEYETSTEIFKALIKKHFTKQTKLLLNKRLYEIFQGRNESIKQYHKNISETAEHLAIINNESAAQTKKKIKEVFLKNLNKNTKLLALDKDLSEPEEIIEYITQREEIHNQDGHNKPSLKENKNTGKYCKYHKVNTHASEECRALKSKTSSNYLFKENFPKFKLPIIKVKLGNVETSALIDTGASENFIAKHLIEKLKLDVEKMEPKEIELANLSKITINKRVKIEFKISNVNDTTYKIPTLIMDESGYDLILGNEFLKTFNIIINYREATLNIDGTEIELDNNDYEYNEQDQTLMEKTRIYNLNSEEKKVDEIKRMIIAPNKQTNPTLGEIANFEHIIRVTTNEPLKFKQYKVPEKYKQMVVEEIQKLLDLNIIRHSNSQFCSPAFPIIKRNNSIRLVIDFRELNLRTEKLPYPIPSMKDLIIDFKKAKVFSTIDLSMGYYQIKMAEDSKKYTSFVINNQQYEFNRLPFGLKNAPMTFQMAMNRLFLHLPFVKIYLDDIIIFSENLESHRLHLKEILKIINLNKISVNFKKSKFCKSELTFLGHNISHTGISPAQERIKDINYIEVNSTKKLQRVLGCINWYRPYLPNLSKKLVPITNKLKQKKITWTKEDQDIISEIFRDINNKPILRFPDFSKPFVLETDASNLAIGAILKQEKQMIDCFSQKLNNTQINYSVMEKELLAILKGLEHFRNIVLGSKIIIFTDNSNILSNNLAQTPRIKRWKFLLNEYDFELTHIKGKTNKTADSLSRIYTTKKVTKENSKSEIHDLHLDEFIKEQHVDLGHPNSKKLYETLKRKYNNKNLNKRIKDFSSQCIECAKEKKNKRLYKIKRLSHHTTKFNEKVCSDIYGPINHKNFKTTLKEDIYFFVFVDTYAKLTRVYQTTDITAQDLINCLSKWIKEFGKPSILFSDRGKQYTSIAFEKFCKMYDIKRILTAPYSPRSNGIVEKRNSSLGNIIRIFRGNSINFIVEKAHNFYNKTVIHGQKITPEEVVFENKRLNKKNSKVKDNKGKQIQLNDIVLLHRPTKSKTESPFKGPFTVREILSEQNAAIIEDETKITLESLHNLKRLS